MSDSIIIGIDPSSRKLAAVISQGSTLLDVRKTDLPEKRPAETCYLAYKFVYDLVYEMQGVDPWNNDVMPNCEVLVCVEAPLSAGARGGVRALIPQAEVAGAILAACGVRGVTVELVPQQSWKKVVVGNGNASKAEIRRWAMKYWRKLWLASLADQDILDAGGINRYGAKMVERMEALNAQPGQQRATRAKSIRRATNANTK
jgi:hypothetical protein